MTRAKQIEMEETIREASAWLGTIIVFLAICAGVVLCTKVFLDWKDSAPVKAIRATKGAK